MAECSGLRAVVKKTFLLARLPTSTLHRGRGFVGLSFPFTAAGQRGAFTPLPHIHPETFITFSGERCQGFFAANKYKEGLLRFALRWRGAFLTLVSAEP